MESNRLHWNFIYSNCRAVTLDLGFNWLLYLQMHFRYFCNHSLLDVILWGSYLLGLSPDLQSMEQIRRVMRPTDVPDQGLLCDLLWSDPDKETMGWGENDRGVSFTFGAEVVAKFLHKHDLDLICRAHQVLRNSEFASHILSSPFNVRPCKQVWDVV